MDESRQPLIIRADAHPEIGTGHFMRCMALATGWKKHGGKVVFITSCKYIYLTQLLQRELIEVVYLPEPHPHSGDLELVFEYSRRYRGAWIVVDGYHFESNYQQSIMQHQLRLLIIDDYAHLDHYAGHLLLNQNMGSEKIPYATSQNTKMLLGPRYALLRPEFSNWIEWPRKIVKKGKKILVTLGGSDLQGATYLILQGIEKIGNPNLEVKIVIGSLNSQSEKIKKVAAKSLLPIDVIENAQNMSALMRWADLAISSGGSTCYELCTMKLPFMTVVIADNQEKIAENLDAAHVSKNLGWYTQLNQDSLAKDIAKLLNDTAYRAQMSLNGSCLVDGNGVQRVVNEMRGYK